MCLPAAKYCQGRGKKWKWLPFKQHWVTVLQSRESLRVSMKSHGNISTTSLNIWGSSSCTANKLQHRIVHGYLTLIPMQVAYNNVGCLCLYFVETKVNKCFFRGHICLDDVSTIIWLVQYLCKWCHYITTVPITTQEVNQPRQILFVQLIALLCVFIKIMV